MMAVVTITGASLAGGIPTGGAVGGASSLTTVGAIPYVTSAGVLGQDATALFWDSANDRLGVGTASPTHTLTVNGIARVASSGTGGIMYIGGDPATGGNFTGRFIVASNRLDIDAILIGSGFRPITLNAAGGNVLFGGTTDGNYKLDVQASGSSGTLRVYDQGGAGSTLAVIQAGAAQSGNLLSVRNNAGTERLYVGSDAVTVGGVNGIFSGETQWALQGTGYGTSGLNLYASGQVVWSSTSLASGTKDSGLKRAAAGYVAVTDGSSGLGKIVVSQSTPAASSDAGTAGAIWADATYIYVQTAAGTVKRIALTTF